MSWNNGYETKRFEARQKKQAEEYITLGMTEEQIQEMYEFDLEQFKSERRHRMHTQQFTSSDFDEGEELVAILSYEHKREKSEIIANRRWFRISFVFR